MLTTVMLLALMAAGPDQASCPMEFRLYEVKGALSRELLQSMRQLPRTAHEAGAEGPFPRMFTELHGQVGDVPLAVEGDRLEWNEGSEYPNVVLCDAPRLLLPLRPNSDPEPSKPRWADFLWLKGLDQSATDAARAQLTEHWPTPGAPEVKVWSPEATVSTVTTLFAPYFEPASDNLYRLAIAPPETVGPTHRISVFVNPDGSLSFAYLYEWRAVMGRTPLEGVQLEVGRPIMGSILIRAGGPLQPNQWLGFTYPDPRQPDTHFFLFLRATPPDRNQE